MTEQWQPMTLTWLNIALQLCSNCFQEVKCAKEFSGGANSNGFPLKIDKVVDQERRQASITNRIEDIALRNGYARGKVIGKRILYDLRDGLGHHFEVVPHRRIVEVPLSVHFRDGERV